MRPGMIFTVEPMINLGRPHVKVLSDGWTAVTRDRSLSAQYEHTIGVTETGCEIFTLSPKSSTAPACRPSICRAGRRLPTDWTRTAGGGWQKPATTTNGVSSPRCRSASRRTPRPDPAEKAALSRPSRPVARALCRGGPDALPDYELLELLLFRLIPRADTKPVAKALLARFGTLAEVLGAPASAAAGGQGHRPGGGARPEDRRGRGAAHGARRDPWPRGAVVLDAASRLLPRRPWPSRTREQFRILFLDKKNALIADEVQQTGTVDHTPVYPREVVKRALELSATAIILVHNHPTRLLFDHARSRFYPLNHYHFLACRTGPDIVAYWGRF